MPPFLARLGISFLPVLTSLISSYLLNNIADLQPSQEKQQDVIAKCTLSEPKHGEVWQTIAKDPKNAYKSTEEVLKIVAHLLE